MRNAELLRLALGGAEVVGDDAERVRAIRDVVALNAAAALVAYDARTGIANGSLVERIAGRLPDARSIIDRGAALEVLDRWRSTVAGLIT